MAGNNKGDFEIKGFHIDLRDEVMTMEGLKKQHTNYRKWD